MNEITLTCEEKGERRGRIRQSAKEINGLDYLVVEPQQSVLKAYLLRKASPNLVEKFATPEGKARMAKRLLIQGGRRITDIKVNEVALQKPDNPKADDYLEIFLNKTGDFSQYTVRVVELDENDHPTDQPMEGFDPRYAQLQFSFKDDCSSDLDCQPRNVCPAQPRPEVEVNYLAKDYAGFRQLILDRLSQTVPGWQERHVPDLGMTLVEILAYAGDYLSYYQDAVATEAYLDTARQRISVRRHARLVDYPMHEGCNARTWIAIHTEADAVINPQEIYFITRCAELPEDGRVLESHEVESKVAADHYEAFAPFIEPPPTQLLKGDDIKDARGLAQKLLTPQDEVSKFINARLVATGAKKNLEELLEKLKNSAAPSAALQNILAVELNRLLRSGAIYSKVRFGDLTQETLDLIAQNPRGDELMRLNRWLLEEAYRDEIAWSARGYLHLYEAHNSINFYTWKDDECCLPRGATSATLQDAWMNFTPPRSRKLRLKVGDVLIFEEVINPKTGKAADANPAHRHAVRLTRVTPLVDELDDQPVVEIEWAEKDRLPFALCLSTIGPAPKCERLRDLGIVRGNVVLADHGRQIFAEEIGKVEEEPVVRQCRAVGQLEDIVETPKRFPPKNHRLQKAPLTFREPSLPTNWAAAEALIQDPAKAVAQIELQCGCDPPNGRWTVQPDLLRSEREDLHFVVEMDNDGHAHLRFGDGESGRLPHVGELFKATYRVGIGPAGNIGAETITHAVMRGNRTNLKMWPRNPWPARGGIAPEPLAQVKLFAPTAFRKRLERAITAGDYAEIAMGHRRVQRAAATMRWMGSWYEILVAIDPFGKVEAEDELLAEIEAYLHRYRRMGHDIVVQRAAYVPLDIRLEVCVLPGHLRGHVKEALLDKLSNRELPDGPVKRGFFHPDKLTFGQAIRLSQLMARAQEVPGVEFIKVTKFERLFEGDHGELDNGILPIHLLEIARLDNDPNFPENGRLELAVSGGR